MSDDKVAVNIIHLPTNDYIAVRSWLFRNKIERSYIADKSAGKVKSVILSREDAVILKLKFNIK